MYIYYPITVETFFQVYMELSSQNLMEYSLT